VPDPHLKAALVSGMEDLQAGREIDSDEYRRKWGVGLVVLRAAGPDEGNDAPAVHP